MTYDLIIVGALVLAAAALVLWRWLRGPSCAHTTTCKGCACSCEQTKPANPPREQEDAR